MRTAELLQSIANWLESPDNEALLLAEGDEHCLKIVAENCILAAQLLKTAAEEVDLLEPPTESVLTPQSIEETAALASAFDASEDPQLKRMASVLDELLLTIAAPPNAKAEKQAVENGRIEELRKKYQEPRQELRKLNQTDKAEKTIKDSGFTKEYRENYHGLSARSCPQHPGAQMSRVGEHMFQCELDHKVYNYETGYTLENGEQIPGGNVDLQTKTMYHENVHSLFDTREGRLGSNF
jgi:hypothetical protein